MSFSFKENISPKIRRLEEILGLSFKVFLITALIVTSLGIYVSTLLFGNHSLQVLERLEKKEQILKRDIKKLKSENAKLHKEYLEWTDAK